MRFVKLVRENLSLGLKVFANQIGISVFALFLYIAVGSMSLSSEKENVVFVCISVFSLLFLAFLVYAVVWEIGAKDRIRVDAGRAERVRAKGLVIAFAAELPNLFFGGIALILGAIARFTESAAVKVPYAVFRIVTQLGLGEYMGIIATAVPVDADNAMQGYLIQSILYFVLPLVAFPVLSLSYRLGYEERKFLLLPSGRKR